MKRSVVPSLDDLRAFEAVVRIGSVKDAAEELALTHGAVSRRVTKLSQELGIPLLERRGRGIAPTQAGSELASAVRTALSDIGRTVQSLRAEAPSSKLVLSCERSIAMRWLIPRLSVFEALHPTLNLHLFVGGGDEGVRDAETSLSLRRLDFRLDPDWIVTHLCDEKVGPVLRPDYSARFEAGDFVALSSRSRPDAWNDWLQRNPGVARPSEVRLFDHHFLVVEAATAGLGVAISPELVASDLVSDGLLSAPFGFQKDGSSYGLIERGPPSEDRIRLRNWLLESFSNPG